jgi:hypothetical protein
MPGDVRLPEYWEDTPALWFARAECTFRLKNVQDEATKFCIVVSALTRDAMRLAADLVEVTPEENAYTLLKARLLASHTMSDLQKVDSLIDMPAVGDRKPTQLLAAMLEQCPRGEEDSIFFMGLFLRKLPQETRVMLAHMDDATVKELAAAADKLYTMRPQSQAAVAAVEEDGELAAVNRDRARKSGRGGARGGQRQAGRGGRGGGKMPEEPELSKAARLASGLCLRHWRYGDKAFSCDGQCCWPGNGQAGGN